MTYRLLADNNYRLGVVNEIPSWLLPTGALADANNMIFDIPGIARQRHGTTALFSGAQTGFSTSLGFCYSQDATTIEELYGYNGRDGNIYSVSKTTGAAVLIDTASGGQVGRSVRHYGFVVFPIMTPTLRYHAAAAGQVSATTFSNAVVAQVAADNKQVTLTGTDVTTNVRVGGIVSISDSTHNYYGRVTSIDTTKIFSVWPAPNWTNAAVPILGVQIEPSRVSFGGGCATSFQQRLLYGNTNDINSTGAQTITDRRVYYSPLPTEGPVTSGVTEAGAAFLEPGQWPALNYFEIPGADPIVAMEPVADNELLILTRAGIVIFRGLLATQTATSAPGITFDISPMNTNAGCLSDLTVQRTPNGIIWASTEGIFVYSGGSKPPLDLTEGLIHASWRTLANSATFAIHGSAYVRNHYIVSGSSGGNSFALAYNLDNGTWAQLSPLDLFLGVPRPTNPSQVFVSRYWNPAVAPPSFVGGQVVRYESIFAPDTWGQTKRDSDGNTINFSAITRSLTDDFHTQRFLRRVGVDYQAEMPAASVTLYGGARLDWQDTNGAELVTLGQLSNTAALTITNATNATPVVVTTSTAHGLQDGDFVDVHAILGNTGANGRYRVTVLTTTTFRLNGSRGSGAYTSGGDVKKITEQEFVGSGMDLGQANYFLVTNSGTVNRFELHGVRLGVMEVARGMGR